MSSFLLSYWWLHSCCGCFPLFSIVFFSRFFVFLMSPVSLCLKFYKLININNKKQVGEGKVYGIKANIKHRRTNEERHCKPVDEEHLSHEGDREPCLYPIYP